MCARDIEFACFYDIPIVLWKCPDGVVCIVELSGWCGMYCENCPDGVVCIVELS